MNRSTYIAGCLALLLVAGGASSSFAANGGKLLYRAFGDSITNGVGDHPDQDQTGWPFRLEDLLRSAGASVTVHNQGVGGEATPEGLTRIDSVLAGGGDLIFIMEGTNDISRQNISPETTKFNLKEMGRKAAARGFEVVYATIIPRYPGATVDSENVANKLVNELIRDLAGGTQRKLVDNFEIFGQAPDRFRRLYADFDKDPVGHPNPTGYGLLSENFFDVLMDVDTVPPVTGLISPSHLSSNVTPRPEISVDIWDFGTRIKRDESFLLVNGKVVDATLTHGLQWMNFVYTPPKNLRQVVSVGVRSRDRNDPANTYDREVARFAIVGAFFLEGDLDHSGRVDGFDMIILALAFGSTFGNERFDPRADLDFNGIVDGADLAILASNFGMSS